MVRRSPKDEVLQRTGLTSLSHLLSRGCILVFGHVTRLDDDTPANMALQFHINVSLNRLLTARGIANLVVHGTSGSNSCGTAMERFHPFEWRSLDLRQNLLLNT